MSGPFDSNTRVIGFWPRRLLLLLLLLLLLYVYASADALTNLSASGTLSGAGFVTLLAPYALLASPVFTGNPTAPTPLAGDNDTSIATTAFVTGAIMGAPNKTITLSGDISGSGMTLITTTLPIVNSNVDTFNNVTVNGKGLVTAASNVTYLTANQTITVSGDATGSGTTAITLTLAVVNANVGTFQGLTINAKGLVTAAVNQNYAPLASPLFTGNPQAPTPATADNSISIATTAWVKAQGYTGGSGVYLPLTGGTLTGLLTINANAAAFGNPNAGGLLRLQQVDGTANVVQMNAFGSNNVLLFQATAGTAASPSATNGIIAAINFCGHDGSAFTASQAQIQITTNTSPWTTATIAPG